MVKRDKSTAHQKLLIIFNGIRGKSLTYGLVSMEKRGDRYAASEPEVRSVSIGQSPDFATLALAAVCHSLHEIPENKRGDIRFYFDLAEAFQNSVLFEQDHVPSRSTNDNWRDIDAWEVSDWSNLRNKPGVDLVIEALVSNPVKSRDLAQGRHLPSTLTDHNSFKKLMKVLIGLKVDFNIDEANTPEEAEVQNIVPQTERQRQAVDRFLSETESRLEKLAKASLGRNAGTLREAAQDNINSGFLRGLKEKGIISADARSIFEGMLRDQHELIAEIISTHCNQDAYKTVRIPVQEMENDFAGLMKALLEKPSKKRQVENVSEEVEHLINSLP